MFFHQHHLVCPTLEGKDHHPSPDEQPRSSHEMFPYLANHSEDGGGGILTCIAMMVCMVFIYTQ